MLLGTERGGLLGPLFILAPLALLALRYAEGRLLLLAAAVLGVPGLAGGEARWLIPCLPFLALAMGLAFRNTPGALGALTAAQVLFCAPGSVGYYCDLDTWRLHRAPLPAALRQVPEDDYLNSRLPGYTMALLLEESVPPGARVLALPEVAAAYTRSDVVSGGVEREAALAAIRDGGRPWRRLRFAFAPRRVLALRARGTESVAEFRVFDRGREVPRAPAWKLRAVPDPRSAALAFDNSYATRWKGGPGAWLEVDFPAPVEAGEVVLECPPGRAAAGVTLEGRLDGGAWSVLSNAPRVENVPPPAHLREAAHEEWRAGGIGYLLVRDADQGAADLREYAAVWGIVPVGGNDVASVYRVE